MSHRHKRMEAKHTKGYTSEELYRILFEQAADGIFIADSSENYIEVNPRGCEMLGYSREEILGFSISDLVPAEDLQQDPLHMEELRSGKMAVNERRLRRKDGTYIHVEISGKMLSDGMILGLVRDMSTRKQSEESLRQAEEKYRNIFEHSLDGIFQSTVAGRFITVNPALARMWGYESPEDLISSINNIALQVYVNPVVRNEFLRVMDQDQEVHGFEIQVYRRDGSVTWVQENVRAVRDANGELLYYEGTVRDISEVKQAEEFLRRSEDRYRRTLNNMLEGCQIIDYDWRYIYVNDTAALQGRRKPEEMLMRSMPELYPDIEKTKMFAVLQRCMEERTPHRMENQFAFPDGDRGWFELSIEPVPEGLFILSVDITERKQAEAALKQSEWSLKEAQRVGRLGSWDWDAENDITTWSEEYYRIYGFDPGQQPPGYKKHLEAYTPESAARLDAAVQKILKTGESYELELEQLRQDGSSRWITARGEVKHSESGRITGLRGTAQDITEHKQAEKELREREVRYRTLFENLPIPVYTKDLEGRYTSFNHEESKYWPASPIGHTDQELLPPEIADALREHDLYVMETKEPWSGEEKFQSPDGLLYTLGRKVPLYNGAGNIIGILGASVDITDRKKAEKELLGSEERYRDLVDNSQELICTHDLEGNILSANPWASKVLGYRTDELLNENIANILLPDSRSAFQNYLAEIQKNGRAQGLLTVQTRTGEQLIWEYNNSLRTEGLKKPIVRGMAHDVTEKIKAEKKIKQQLARLTALSEIDRSIASSFDLSLTLNQLIRHVIRQLEVEAASILLANPVTNTLEYFAGEGFPGRAPKTLKLRLGEEYAGKVALERRMIRISNLETAEPPFSQPYLTESKNPVTYYGLPLIAKGQLKGVMEVFQHSTLDRDEDWFSYLETLAEQAAIAIDNAQLFSNLQHINTELSLAYDATIEGWSYALDLRDKETEGHTRRVTEMTNKLATKFGLSEKELTYTRWGALLHDIGKMGVPDAILQKPDKLTEEEWEIMKMHPTFARNMLERINYLKTAIDIPYCHHEKWDGSGYPRGLQGEQIPLSARIFAIADVWDALTSNRPYRPAWSRDDTLNYIRNEAGTHFDPQLVNLFLESRDVWNDSNE